MTFTRLSLKSLPRGPIYAQSAKIWKFKEDDPHLCFISKIEHFHGDSRISAEISRQFHEDPCRKGAMVAIYAYLQHLRAQQGDWASRYDVIFSAEDRGGEDDGWEELQGQVDEHAGAEVGKGGVHALGTERTEV